MTISDLLLRLLEYGIQKRVFDDMSCLLDSNTLEIYISDSELLEDLKQQNSAIDLENYLELFLWEKVFPKISIGSTSLFDLLISNKYCTGLFVTLTDRDTDCFVFEIYASQMQ